MARKHHPKTNVRRAMESYKDNYDSHAEGLVQEAIQNAADAKLPGVKWADWKIVIRYDRAARVLRIRDYGTTGMPHCDRCKWGELDDGEECTAKECNWGLFHSFAYLGKELGDLGSRGQGKSLAIVAGTSATIRTSPAGETAETMASRWSIEDDDWVWELGPGEAPPKDWDPGTEIEIRGVIDEVHDALVDEKEMIEDIQARWFPILELGGLIRFGYESGSLKAIPRPRLPPIATDQDQKQIFLARPALLIKHPGDQIAGELRNLRLYLTPTAMAEDDKRLGIALIKNGKQVITRLTKFPRRIPPDLAARVFGQVEVPCNKETPFLEKAETPDHRGYKATDKVFQKVKGVLEEELEQFLKPYMKQLSPKRVSDKDKEKAARALEYIQKALEAVPALKVFGGGEVPPPNQPEPPKTHPYISHLDLEKERYSRGENVKLEAIILNPLERELPYYDVVEEYRDASLQLLETRKKSPVLRKAARDDPGRTVVVFERTLAENLQPGRYRLLVRLVESVPGQEQTKTDAKGKWLWIDTPPLEIKRPRKPKVGKDEGHFENTLRELHPVDDEAIPPDNEVIFTEETATMWFNLQGVRLSKVWGKVKPDGMEYSVLYSLVAEELGRALAKRKSVESGIESWTAEQVTQFYEEIAEVQTQFLRACHEIQFSGQG